MWLAAELLFLVLLVISLTIVAVGIFQHDMFMVKRWLIASAAAFIIFIIIASVPSLWSNCACYLHNCCSPGCSCSCTMSLMK